MPAPFPNVPAFKRVVNQAGRRRWTLKHLSKPNAGSDKATMIPLRRWGRWQQRIQRIMPKIPEKVPKLPRGGPAIVPKPLPPRPESTSVLKWLKENSGLLVLNFGSICTLLAFTRSDVVELRLLSMTGSASSVIYFATRKPRVYMPMAWSSIFVMTNAFMLYKIFEERSGRVIMSAEEQSLYEEHFLPHGVTPRQFERLMSRAKQVKFPKGAIIVKQGELMDKVRLVVSGRTVARGLGRHLTSLSSAPGHREKLVGGDAGAWIGEMNFLEEMSAQELEKQQEKKKKDQHEEKTTTTMTTTKSKPPLPLSTPLPPAEITGKGGGVGLSFPIKKETPKKAEATKAPTPPERPVGRNRRAMVTYEAVEDTVVLEWTHADLQAILDTSADMRSAMTRAMTAAVVGKVVNLTVSKSSGSLWTNWLSRGQAFVKVTVEDEDDDDDDDDDGDYHNGHEKR